MKKSWFPVVLIFLVACAAREPWEYEADLDGFVWPAVCRRDLSGLGDVVEVVPRERIEALTGTAAVATTLEVDGVWRIYMAPEMDHGWVRGMVEAHERCHRVAADIYWGKGWGRGN